MKIILEDIWYAGIHYDHVEILRDDINDDVDEETILNAINEFFNEGNN